ncbi:hypothetical protein B0A55_09280 [Friedmanniomyces simplex]|uniref:Uncharacterized protein n=1 Tax=Friedmanniomyces simplex TaxID=329884 RepID=A0A4U0WSP5_9PEZI|nr:hypothetical protein B0A55_09280 [Friedmanniomyces simplex]
MTIPTDLEDPSRQFAHQIPSRHFTDPIFDEYLDPNIHATWEPCPSATNRSQYLAELERFISASPQYDFAIVNSCCTVRPSKRKATVWLTLNITGVPVKQYGGVSRETVVKLDWRLTRSGWRCVRKKGVRGSAAFGGKRKMSAISRSAVKTATGATFDVFEIDWSQAIGAHLEHLSRQFAQHVQAHDFSSPVFAHLAPEVDAAWEDFPPCSSREQYLAMLEEIAKRSPRYGCEVLNTCSAVRKSGRKATVWLTVLVTGLPVERHEEMHRESVMKLEWSLGRNRGWKCVRKMELRGSGSFG